MSLHFYKLIVLFIFLFIIFDQRDFQYFNHFRWLPLPIYTQIIT